MYYRILCPFLAIGTIGEKEYIKYGKAYKKRGNQHVKTLIVNDYSVFKEVRNEYKNKIGGIL
jgi:hypothetical protein